VFSFSKTTMLKLPHDCDEGQIRVLSLGRIRSPDPKRKYQSSRREKYSHPITIDYSVRFDCRNNRFTGWTADGGDKGPFYYIQNLAHPHKIYKGRSATGALKQCGLFSISGPLMFGFSDENIINALIQLEHEQLVAVEEVEEVEEYEPMSKKHRLETPWFMKVICERDTSLGLFSIAVEGNVEHTSFDSMAYHFADLAMTLAE